MRVRYTVPGWQPTMPRGLAPVRPPVAFREMLRSREGVPDTDWKAPLRVLPKASLAPALEAPVPPRGVDLQTAERSRNVVRGMLTRLPAEGGAAMAELRQILAEQAAFENRVLVRAAGGSTRG